MRPTESGRNSDAQATMGIQFWPITEHRSDVDQAKTAGLAGAYSLATLCWLLSAGVYIAVKAVATEMPPWTLCFWRVFLAGLILLPVIRQHWTPVVTTVRQRYLEILVVGGLGFAITQGLMFTGLNYTTAINAGLILALMPVITMILARFLLNEALRLPQIAGAVLACIGMAIIVVRGDLSALLHLQLNAGELFIVGAAICFAFYTVLLRKAKFELPRLPLLVLLLEAGAVVALPFYIWEILHDERTALNTRGLLALAYTIAPGGALMYYLFNRSVEALGASKAGVLLYLQTVFVAILAFFFLGERLLPYHFAGAGSILAGVLLTTLFKSRSTTK
jgi:drug/metabolite transporter (DMT)-like permease